MENWVVTYMVWKKPVLHVEFGRLLLFFTIEEVKQEFGCMLIGARSLINRKRVRISNEVLAGMLPIVLSAIAEQLAAWHRNRPNHRLLDCRRAYLYVDETERFLPPFNGASNEAMVRELASFCGDPPGKPKSVDRKI